MFSRGEKQSPLIKPSTRYIKKNHFTEGKSFSAFHNYAHKCLLLLQILPNCSYRHCYNVRFLDFKFTFNTICIKGGPTEQTKSETFKKYTRKKIISYLMLKYIFHTTSTKHAT